MSKTPGWYFLKEALGENPAVAQQALGADSFGWEAGTRTPIARSRVWSPTIGRPPSKRNLNLRIEAPVVNSA